ncbi:DUF6197 family protein [Candidatus Poriferisocius sp.]|uniref:DUF6197 family protein n=1 Tax=Candidatus Poriferisocius sp. TaxID=3101276 RepID=UPI003B026827
MTRSTPTHVDLRTCPQPTVAEAITIVEEARDILGSPSAWCQFALALSEHGESLQPDDPDACAWCLTGAIDAAACIYVSSDSQHPAVIAARSALAEAISSGWVMAHPVASTVSNIAEWNDASTRSWSDVSAALDRAEDILLTHAC